MADAFHATLVSGSSLAQKTSQLVLCAAYGVRLDAMTVDKTLLALTQFGGAPGAVERLHGATSET
jgi:hypothetical protein